VGDKDGEDEEDGREEGEGGREESMDGGIEEKGGYLRNSIMMWYQAAYDAYPPSSHLPPFPLPIIKLKTKIKSTKSRIVQKTQTHHPPRQRAPLRTHPHRKTRIFDIGTRDDGAVVGEEGGADAEIGVGTWMGGLS